MAGLYLHIPFCKSRCIYCAFYSTTFSNLHEAYIDALCREMDTRPLPGDGCRSVYLGGGTPSQLSPTLLRRLLLYIYKVYRVDDDAEVTIECNPDDITPQYAEAIAQLPVNRISLGAQTFCDERLRWLRRRHSARQVAEAVGLLRAAGIRNISIDLMFGFPGETLASWQEDIRQALALDVEHISAYALMVEEGTPLCDMLAKGGQPDEADDELSRRMYETLADELRRASFEHYEISNFARRTATSGPSPYRSRHNSSYWNATPYLGLGAAAHSYDGDRRWWNKADVRQYISDMQAGRSAVEEVELLTAKMKYNDLITTAMRTADGLSIGYVEATLGPAYKDYLMATAEPHLRRGLLAEDKGRLHLTRRALFVSDDIMSDLIMVDSCS